MARCLLIAVVSAGLVSLASELVAMLSKLHIHVATQFRDQGLRSEEFGNMASLLRLQRQQDNLCPRRIDFDSHHHQRNNVGRQTINAIHLGNTKNSSWCTGRMVHRRPHRRLFVNNCKDYLPTTPHAWRMATIRNATSLWATPGDKRKSRTNKSTQRALNPKPQRPKPETLNPEPYSP